MCGIAYKVTLNETTIFKSKIYYAFKIFHHVHIFDIKRQHR